MSIEDAVSFKSHYSDRDTIQALPNASYIALRPTFDTGQSSTICLLEEAEDFKIDYGPTNGPSYLMAEYGTAQDAIEAMIAIKAAYPHLCIWYNGQEVQEEIIGDIWVGLAEVLREIDFDWEMVSQIASGTLTSDNCEVLEVIDRDPLIAAAVANVTS